MQSALLLFVLLWICRSQNVCKNVCTPGSETCAVDSFVGDMVIYEDRKVRIWVFKLAPGEMTSMHRHDCDYHFVAITPTQLEVWSERGERLFDFRAEGVLGFEIQGDELVQIPPFGAGVDPPASFQPIRVPRIHAARNIGNDTYHEFLFESLQGCV